MSIRYDDAVVGAGVLGLAHAYHLARRGRRVVVVERSTKAQGASVRNFGMIWPTGQPAGPRRDLALRSQSIWLDVLRAAGLWHEQVGSLHLAYEADEEKVLGEFLERERESESEFASGLRRISPAEVAEIAPAVEPISLQICASREYLNRNKACSNSTRRKILGDPSVQISRSVGSSYLPLSDINIASDFPRFSSRLTRR